MAKNRDNIRGWKNLGGAEGTSMRIRTNGEESCRVSQAVELKEVGTTHENMSDDIRYTTDSVNSTISFTKLSFTKKSECHPFIDVSLQFLVYICMYV